MMPSLIFADLEKAKNNIMASQQQQIENLYKDWSAEVLKKAHQYSLKTTSSSYVSQKQMEQLASMLKATSQQVSNEIYGIVKGNIYTVADLTVKSNAKWLASFGFSEDGVNAAFSNVPDDVVRMLITGQIYDSGWSLSKRIWSDNESTMRDVYQIMAKGVAENKPIFEIAKELGSYVDPAAKKSWNPVLAMKNTKTGKIEYKRIYKSKVDYNAQRLARTLVQHGYQQSFIAVTKDNPFIIDYIWHSNGSRVCELCLARDGMHFKKDELPMDHPNGMCVMEPAIVSDMVDQLAEWFNSPDGTYPEIDAFASNFGYAAKPIKTVQDFLDKYGMSTKSPSAWYNSLTNIQKAEAKALKSQSGLSWEDWYKKNVFDSGDPIENFINQYGTSTKSPSAWFNSMTSAQKAQAKLLKDQSGLTWNQWYEKYIYSGTTPISKTKATKAVAEMTGDMFEELVKKMQNPKTPLDEFSKAYDKLDEILKKQGMVIDDIFGYNGYDLDIIDYNKYEAVKNALNSSKIVASNVKSAAASKVDDVAQSLDDVLAAAQKKLNAIQNKTYSGIWKQDVSLDDYESLQSKIPAKKQYYHDQIAKLGDTAEDLVKKAKFQSFLDDLDEFEEKGKAYVQVKNEVKLAQSAINKAKAPSHTGSFSADVYTDEAKAAAKSFTSRTTADKYHRQYLDSIWDEYSEYEKYSVWEYTHNSNPMNKPLSGYHDTWDRYGFKGLGNTNLGYEDSWRHFNSSAFERKFGTDGHVDYKKTVQSLTTAIDKSEMQDAVFLVRGSDNNGFAGLLEGDLISFDDAKSLLKSGDASAIKSALEGQTFTNHSFLSTGIADDAGFSGSVKYKIYAPQGTKAIYAEPASYYGNTISGEEIYKAGQSYSGVGSEAEIIIQRGTEFRITNIDVDSRRGNFVVEMEVVGQPDYFTTGLEHTHNGGKTSYNK